MITQKKTIWHACFLPGIYHTTTIYRLTKKEPAKYEFSYEVNDPPSGLSFGQTEMRDGDLTTGQYNVLLPDGRKQVSTFLNRYHIVGFIVLRIY